MNMLDCRLMAIGARDAQQGTIQHGMADAYYRAHRQQKEAMS